MIAAITEGRVRAARPISGLRREFMHEIRQQFVKQAAVILPTHRVLPTGAIRHALFNLVVAAPQRHAGMMAQAADVVLRFGFDVRHEIGVEAGIGAAGEHEILPDGDSVFVAQIIKGIVFVDAAAPNAQHIHVGIGCWPVSTACN